jgi:hypothetical protein
VDDRERRTEAEAMLALGSVLGVAIALMVAAHATGTARAAELALGIIVGLAALLGLWWRARQRKPLHLNRHAPRSRLCNRRPRRHRWPSGSPDNPPYR